MKNLIRILWMLVIFASCQEHREQIIGKKADFEKRQSEITDLTRLSQGKTYLPVYSHIYHMQEDKTFDLTITISIRNVSITDSVYILKADYFNTDGQNIRQYLKSPIYLVPMETIEIVIAEEDREGGSGANFLFEWAVKNEKNPPLFEAVMISTYGQQGISFLTRGIQVFE